MSIQVAQQSPTDNVLLSGLLVHERNAVQRVSAVVGCDTGQVLVTAKGNADYMFFPIEAVLAPVRRIGNGSGFDLALVGREGIIGCDSLIDRRKQIDEVVVRSGGTAFCMPADDFRRQFDRRGGLHNAVLRFASAFVLQLGQNAVCSRFHPLEARVARWLLMIHDRVSAEVELSADSIAPSLGADPQRVAEVLERLSAAAAIRLRKSGVSIVDAERLETRACDCYDELRQIYDDVK